MRHRQQFLMELVAYSQKIKQFLSTFKVEMCQNPYPHHTPYCHYYHSPEDRRRNPYKEHDFLYKPSQTCQCTKDDCPNYHNVYEYYYHPLIYKTSSCQSYACQYDLICIYYHDHEIQMLKRYQFFRFELETFKTELCPHRQQPSNLHELSSCRFFHNQSDKRRNPTKITYCHVQCENRSCNNPNCQYAHNKIQQLYHPARYKTKYCQSFINKRSCQYNEYCSFAHSDQQIKIELLHLLPQDENFLYYKYKTVWCPYTTSHDRANCPYAHNFQDFRRDPKKKAYSSQICPFWHKGQIKSIEDAGCPLKMECDKSHGWLQNKYHPDLLKKGFPPKAQALDIQLEKPDSIHSSKKKSKAKDNTFGVGAPFFKREEKKDERSQRSKSQNKYSQSMEKQKPKPKIELEKAFNFSFFIPDEDNWSAQNDENYFNKNDIQACWTQQSLSGKKSSKINKNLKKSKVEYTKSLKQLLSVDRYQMVYEKLTQHKISQIKLLGLSAQQLQKFGMSSEQRVLVENAIKEYSRSHKLDKVKYTDSLAKIFRQKKLALTMDKLLNRGVTQSYLQKVNQSTIQDFSFLQEEEKSNLSKILEVYENEQEFKQLNKLIQKQTNEKTVKHRRASGASYFKN